MKQGNRRHRSFTAGSEVRQVSLPPTAFKGKTTPEFCATFVLFCAVYAEFCATLLVGDSDICYVYTVAF